MIFTLVLGPVAAGLLLLLVPRSADAFARAAGVLVAVGALALAILARGADDESVRWLARPFAANFHVGLGGLSFWLVALLALSTACALAVANVSRLRDFVAQMLFLLGAMNGVFVARDLLLFALFWDAMLIPVFLMLVAWSPPAPRGGDRMQGPAWRYLVYNLVGGLTLLLATAAYGVVQGTTDVIGVDPAKLATISSAWSLWIFAGFALAFLIKTPVWPLHTWMPETYADLPAPAVAVVSAVQSKAGLYGFIAIGLFLFGGPMHAARPLFFALGLIALIYGALIALVQDDAKRIVAYSSLSHLGLIVLAIFSLNSLALAGAIVYIVAHGLFSAGLFIVLGEIETREGTRCLSRLGGLAARHPRLAGGLMLVALAALGLPGLCGFAGEILILTGLYQAGFGWQAAVALIPIVLAAAYLLRLFQDMMQGPVVSNVPERADMSPLEIAALIPLGLAIVVLGVAPGPVIASAGQYETFAKPAPAAPPGRWLICPLGNGSHGYAIVYVPRGGDAAAACAPTSAR